jgi:hypothetical protein
MRVIASIKEGNTKRAEAYQGKVIKKQTAILFGKESKQRITSKLCITLFHIAQPLREQLNRDIFIVHQQMFLRCCPRKIDKRIGISSQACYSSNDISANRFGNQSI